MVNKDLHILQFCEGELVARNRVSINFFLSGKKENWNWELLSLLFFYLLFAYYYHHYYLL